MASPRSRDHTKVTPSSCFFPSRFPSAPQRTLPPGTALLSHGFVPSVLSPLQGRDFGILAVIPTAPPAPIPAPRIASRSFPCVISEIRAFLEIFLGDPAAASSPGNPPVPSHCSRSTRLKLGGNSAQKLVFPNPATSSWETSTKPKPGFSAGSRNSI